MVLPELGDILMGKYRLEDVLGEGGFGVVYRATTLSSGRPVAIKVLKPGKQGYDPVRAERFMRELRTVAKLTSPHTVTLFDYGRTTEDVLLMVCEMVDGEDLSVAMHRRDRFTDAETVHVISQVLRSLKEAHDLGVLHRDIKPPNIRLFQYFDDPMRAKVLDFGLTKSLQDDETPLTQAGKVIGTPRYMSPEQLRGDDLKPATDIYSLGLVAYEMLVGRPATIATKAADQVQISAGDPVQRGLRVIINRMLAVDVTVRYRSASDVLTELKALKLPRPRLEAAPQTERSEPAADIAPTVEDSPVESTEVVLAAGDLPGPTELDARPTLRRIVPDDGAARRRLWPLALLAVLLVVISVWAAAGPDEPETHVVRAPSSKNVGSVLRETPTPPPPPPPSAESASLATGCGRPSPFFGIGTLVRKSGATSRSYEAHVPRDYDRDRPSALVLLVDDEGPSAPMLKHSRLEVESNRQSFVVVRVGSLFSNLDRLMGALDAAAENLCIDERRVFGIGVGSGAQTLSGLLCDVPIVAMATAGARPTPFKCARRIPHIHFIDVDDQGGFYRGIAPPAGANDPYGGRTHCRPMVPGAVPDFVNRWAGACESERREIGDSCAEWECGGPLVVCAVSGGRLWQTGPRSDCLGVENRVYPYANRMWAFFNGELLTDEGVIRPQRVRP